MHALLLLCLAWSYLTSSQFCLITMHVLPVDLLAVCDEIHLGSGFYEKRNISFKFINRNGWIQMRIFRFSLNIHFHPQLQAFLFPSLDAG